MGVSSAEHSDKGTEFFNNSVHTLCLSEGIMHELSPCRTPQLNGLEERSNRTVMEVAKSIHSAAKFPKSLWVQSMMQ